MKRNEFTFLISALVPNSFCPRGRTLTLASQRSEPSSTPEIYTDSGVKDDFLQPRQIFISLVGRCDVGFADNLDQRHAGAVQVDGGLSFGAGKALVQALARVFFKMHPRDADLFFPALEETSMYPNSASGLSYCEIW